MLLTGTALPASGRPQFNPQGSGSLVFLVSWLWTAQVPEKLFWLEVVASHKAVDTISRLYTKCETNEETGTKFLSKCVKSKFK